MSDITKAAKCTIKEIGHAIKNTGPEIPSILKSLIVTIPCVIFLLLPTIGLVLYVKLSPNLNDIIGITLLGLQTVWFFIGILIILMFDKNYQKVKREGKCD